MPYLSENRQLLNGFRQGEATALSEVYLHYAPGLGEFLRCGFAFDSRGKRCFFQGFRAPFDLENAMQEVFLRAFSESARSRYDGLRPYVNYLYAIARNYVIDEFRRRSAAIEFFAELDGEHPDAVDSDRANTPYDPRVAAEEREIERLLETFLQHCEERVQTYYQVRYERGLTQNEVAREMGLTRIQIRRIEARFKREILDYFKGQGYLAASGSRQSKHGWATSLMMFLVLW